MFVSCVFNKVDCETGVSRLASGKSLMHKIKMCLFVCFNANDFGAHSEIKMVNRLGFSS